MDDKDRRTPWIRLGRDVWFPLLLWLAMRLVLTAWAAVAVSLYPQPATPDETLRPYLGAETLSEGPAAWLLGPWQRFDTNRYVRLARDGYAAEEDSVFPPLFPWLMRGIGLVVPAATTSASVLAAAIVISSIAGAGAFLLFYRLSRQKIGGPATRRALLYLACFPTAFYLFAGYTEALFLLLALSSFWALERDRAWLAGLAGLLATLTRTAGVALTLPLLARVWEAWRAGERRPWALAGVAMPAALPAAGLLAFLAYRRVLGLPSLSSIYATYWFQTTGFPGTDLVTAARVLVTGQGVRAGEFTLWLDILAALLLLASLLVAFRRYGARYGLYAAGLVFFMLLPRSDLKPLYSFTRYALVVFPLFWWWGEKGANPWWHRLFLYTSLLLLLYLSGQFFLWGWVA